MALELSDLWKNLTSSRFADIDGKFFETFRTPGNPAQRTNAWDPYEKSSRYYKFLLFKVAQLQSDSFFELFCTLRNTMLGGPLTVRVRGLDIDIDYLMATEEFMFLRDAFPVSGMRHLTEIGAGFGRTCHALLSYLPDVQSYTIIDLPEMLDLSRGYLSRVAPDLVHKVRFVDWQDTGEWAKGPQDLVININSFQEMPVSTIHTYLAHVDAISSHFYVKNPVCKYEPGAMGLTIDDPAKLYDTFSLGLCNAVADIFDEDALAGCRTAYEQAYLPAPGWLLARSQPQSIFTHVQHTAYSRRA